MLSKHLIYLISPKKQSSIGFKVGDFTLPHPVVDSLLLDTKELRHLNDVELLRFQWRANDRIEQLVFEDE